MEIQLAPKKRATGVLSILFLRGPLFAIDTMMNITVPTFEPCVVSLRLIEKATNEYNVCITNGDIIENWKFSSIF